MENWFVAYPALVQIYSPLLRSIYFLILDGPITPVCRKQRVKGHWRATKVEASSGCCHANELLAEGGIMRYPQRLLAHSVKLRRLSTPKTTIRTWRSTSPYLPLQKSCSWCDWASAPTSRHHRAPFGKTSNWPLWKASQTSKGQKKICRVS